MMLPRLIVLTLAIPLPFLAAGAETWLCVSAGGIPKEKLEDIASCAAGRIRLDGFSFSSNARRIKVGGGDTGLGPGLKFTDRMKVGDSNSETWKVQYQVTVASPGFLIDAVGLLVTARDWKNGNGSMYTYLCIAGAFETALQSGSCSGTLFTVPLNPSAKDASSSAITSFTGVASLWVLDAISLNSRGQQLEVVSVGNQFRLIPVPRPQ